MRPHKVVQTPVLILLIFGIWFHLPSIHTKSGLSDNEQDTVQTRERILFKRTKPLHAVVEVGVVCDKSFSWRFDYNLKKITEILVLHIQELEKDFQSLTLTKLSFTITSVLVIQKEEDQLRITPNWGTNSDNHHFQKWVYNHKIANTSDVVLLIRGAGGSWYDSFMVGNLCKIDDFEKDYLSTVLYKWDLSEGRRQKDLSVAFAHLLGAKMDTETQCATFPMLMHNRHPTYSESVESVVDNVFSTCSDFAIYKTLNSPEASCLKETRTKFERHRQSLNTYKMLWTYLIITTVTILVLALLILGIYVLRKHLRSKQMNLEQIVQRSVSKDHTSESRDQNHGELLDESFFNGAIKKHDPDLQPTEQLHVLPFDKNLEFPADRLTLGTIIGNGAFGSVFKADAEGIIESGTTTTVAVKTASSTGDILQLNALKSELKILGNATHINVVNLLGACTRNSNQTEGQLYMILEYCKFGSLRNFLLTYRKNSQSGVSNVGFNNAEEPPSQTDLTCYQGDYEESTIKSIKSSDLIAWSTQIARGMDYLASKQILHGDLAARNVLLSDNNVVKICDFGLSKQLTSAYDFNYKKSMENAMVPFKWMAIESLTLGLFSTQSDCWSFGIVLWEIFSLGDLPYPGEVVNDEFVERIGNGHRLKQPRYASSRLYQLMLSCWSKNSDVRPKFSYLVEELEKLLEIELRDNHMQIKMETLLNTSGRCVFTKNSAGYVAFQ